jgi:hypothetical protein
LPGNATTRRASGSAKPFTGLSGRLAQVGDNRRPDPVRVVSRSHLPYLLDHVGLGRCYQFCRWTGATRPTGDVTRGGTTDLVRAKRPGGVTPTPSSSARSRSPHRPRGDKMPISRRNELDIREYTVRLLVDADEPVSNKRVVGLYQTQSPRSQVPSVTWGSPLGRTGTLSEAITTHVGSRTWKSCADALGRGCGWQLGCPAWRDRLDRGL